MMHRVLIRLLPVLLLAAGLLFVLPRATAAPKNWPNLPANLLQAGTTQNILVDFYSPYCGYCTKMEPTVAELKRAYGGKLRFLRIDITQEKNYPLQDSYKVNGTPTYMFFAPDGKALYRIVGASEKQLKRTAKKYATEAPKASAAKP